MTTANTHSPEIVLILKEAEVQLGELKRWAPFNWYDRHLYEKATRYFQDRSDDNYKDASAWLHKCAVDRALPEVVRKRVLLAMSICNN